MQAALESPERRQELLRIWCRHVELMPRFDTFLRDRERRAAGAWVCPRCGESYASAAEWRAKTVLVERFTIVDGRRAWERRRCGCGAAFSLPTGKGEE